MGIPKELERVRLTKKEQLEEWVSKALFYTKKENTTKILPKPGEIYTADMGVNVGSEINGVRPFFILTATTYNGNSGTVTGIPLSQKEFAIKGQVRVDNEILDEGKVSGVLKTEMITTISKGRIGTYIDRLNDKGIHEVGKALETFLIPLKRLKKKKSK